MEVVSFKKAVALNQEIENLKQKIKSLDSNCSGQSMFIKSGTTFFLTEEENNTLTNSIRNRLTERLNKAQEDFNKI